jgi:hypothetical protein
MNYNDQLPNSYLRAAKHFAASSATLRISDSPYKSSYTSLVLELASSRVFYSIRIRNNSLLVGTLAPKSY